MNQPIDIFFMSEEVVQKSIENPPSPKRNQYEELTIITGGSPRFNLDFKPLAFTVPAMIYTSFGRIHELIPDLATRGWRIRFKNEFLPPTNFHFYDNYSNINYYDLGADNCLQNIESLCTMISAILKQAPPDLNLVKRLLKALLSTAQYARNIKAPSNGKLKNPDLVILKFFLHLLEDNYKQMESVQFYADKMFMSIQNLNRLSQLFFKQSISVIIENRKLVEARKLLGNSNMTIAEIGYSLGYKEKSYFTRVFHKKTGYTPSAYRIAMQSVLP